MDEKRSTEIAVDGMIVRSEPTDFGREVGRDEIDWWITRRETDLKEFHSRTLRAYEAAQVLIKASAGLKNQRPESYDALLSTLKDFAERHLANIESLYDYVRWLEAKLARIPPVSQILRTRARRCCRHRW